MAVSDRGGEVLAVIPARGGSKGIPGKNVRPLAGRPMIEYSIAAALSAASVDRVVVTTDDTAIAEVAHAAGAEVPFLRPAELAADNTTDLPVFQHCLAWLRETERYEPRVVVHLRPTAPLRTSAHIDQAVTLFGRADVDSVRTVSECLQHPLKAWSLRPDGVLEPFVPFTLHGISEPYNQPRQALPRAFAQNGSVDVTSPDVIFGGSMTGKTVLGLVMDPRHSINVDHEVDFLLAELLLTTAGGRTS